MGVGHTLVAFLVAIGLLVLVHEWGHYAVARLFGVRVLRFSVGFGHPLFSWTGRNGTEWVVAAIPLGGYVKMLDGREALVPPGARGETFDGQSPLVRIAIVLAGPLANFLLAFLLYVLVAWLGVVEPLARVAPPPESPAARLGIHPGERIVAVAEQPAETWPQVRWRLLAAVASGLELVTLELVDDQEEHRVVAVPLTNVVLDPDRGDPLAQLGLVPHPPYLPPIVGAVAPNSPAAAIGLQVGDRIVAIDGEPLSDWRSLAERIRALPGREVVLRWERGGTELVQRVTIAVATDRDGQTIGRLGVQPAPAAGEQRLVRYSGWAALAYGWQKTGEVSLLTLRLLGKMVVGEASVKNLSGPLTIASAAATSAELGLVPYLAFLALVSVSLGVLNLLPIPVLDGGHLLYHLWEWVRGRPLPEAVQQLGQKIGLVLIGMLMAIALVNDFLRGLG